MKNPTRAAGYSRRAALVLMAALTGLNFLAGPAAAQFTAPPPIRIRSQGPSAMELNLFGLNSWDRTYLTARSKGMGGVVLGLDGSSTSGSLNPAALASLSSPQLASEARVKGGSGSTSGQAPNIVGSDGTIIEVSEYSPGVSGSYSYNDVSFSMPILLLNRRAGVGLGYHRVLDFRNGEETRMKIEAPLGEADLGQGFEFQGGVNALTPALGWQVNPKLSLGAALNFMSGTITENGNQGVTVFGFVFARGTLLYDQKVSGTSLDLGAQYLLSDRLTLGAALQPGYSLSFREGFYSYQPLPTEQTTTPQIFIFERPLLDHKLSVPTQWGLGGTYKMMDGRLLFGADYWSRPWSKSTYSRRNFAIQPIFADTLNLANAFGAYVVGNSDVEKNASFVDTSHLRLGMEYIVKQASSPSGVQIPFRIGFRREPLTLANADPDSFISVVSSIRTIGANPALSDGEKRGLIGDALNTILTQGYNLIATNDKVNATTISVGSGISVGAFAFDVSYARSSFTLDRIFLGSFSDLTISPNPQVVREKRTSTEITLSSSLRF